jgi:hypothetical protein
LLNVLDRTPRPSSLLAASHSLLKPDGLLLLATPLPFRPFYFTANHDTGKDAPKYKDPKYGKPLETLLTLRSSNSWDEQAESFLSSVLPENGFRPVAFTRLPYISGGDFFDDYVALDDLVVVAEKIEK